MDLGGRRSQGLGAGSLSVTGLETLTVVRYMYEGRCNDNA